MAANILDPSAVIAALPSALPDKKLESQHDGIVALLHTVLNTLQFRLVAVDESSSASTTFNGVLPEGWNKYGPGHYTLRYRHEQSSLEFVIKVSKLGSRTMFNAIALESDKASSLDVATDDFTSPSFFPYDGNATDAQPLIHGFISSNRVADLISQLKLKIVQKLVPGLRKEGYTEESEPGDSSRSTQNPRRDDPPPARPRPSAPPRSPYPYTDPSASHILPDNPLQIGRRDLDPFPNASNPFAPPPLFPQSGGDGMFVGPDHPIFGRGRQGQGIMPNRGPWGGDGFLPPMGAPPGARFDPVGPGMGPFPGRGGFSPRGGPPDSGNLRDPDNDEFMPPGAGDMYM